MWMTAAFLLADSQPKSIGLVWVLAATWRWVCIHHMNRMNSRNGATPWWQLHKYRCGIIIINYYYYLIKLRTVLEIMKVTIASVKLYSLLEKLNAWWNATLQNSIAVN